MYITLLVLKGILVEPWTGLVSDKQMPAVKRLSMLTNKNVTVSTRVGKVVSHIRSVSSLVHGCGQFLCRDTGRKTPWNFPNLNNIHSRDDGDNVVMQLSQGRTLTNIIIF